MFIVYTTTGVPTIYVCGFYIVGCAGWMYQCIYTMSWTNIIPAISTDHYSYRVLRLIMHFKVNTIIGWRKLNKSCFALSVWLLHIKDKSIAQNSLATLTATKVLFKEVISSKLNLTAWYYF